MVMKEPTREEWAEDFLSEAHNELNKAAVNGKLCNRGNEARLLIGRALTVAGQRAGRSALGRWPDEAIEKVKEAQSLLRAARSSPEAECARHLCDDAARLIEQGGRLMPEFSSRAKNREVAARFFGNVRVANDGKGHGVPLDKPLVSAQAKTDQGAATVKADEQDGASGWKQRTQDLRADHRPRRGKGHA
jgi:hypothetical protein